MFGSVQVEEKRSCTADLVVVNFARSSWLSIKTVPTHHEQTLQIVFLLLTTYLTEFL